MEINDLVKNTLEKTYRLALGLEIVNKSISPYNKPSARDRRRLISIQHSMDRVTENEPPTQRSSSISPSKGRKSSTVETKASLFNSRQVLVRSIRSADKKVTLCKSGKKRLATIIGQLPPLQEHPALADPFKTADSDPLPYLSMDDGKLEDPLSLPSVQEFFKGVSERDVFIRIDRAVKALQNFCEKLDEEVKQYYHSVQRRNQRRLGILKPKSTHFTVKDLKEKPNQKLFRKTEKIMERINFYYSIPRRYTRNRENSEERVSLEDSHSEFTKVKAIEDERLKVIIDRMKKDKPINLKTKISLFDKDKLKIKNFDISKFNMYKTRAEYVKRQRRFEGFRQGLAYISCLDKYKRDKHCPNESELLLLEIWRKLLIDEWPITLKELDLIIQQFSPQQIEDDNVKDLIQSIKATIQDK